MRVRQGIEEFRQDVKYALRQLRQSPGFTAVATITLALGIGANGAIFALVDAILLRSLPFHDPDRLVMVWTSTSSSPRRIVSPLDMTDWHERNRTFESIGGYVPNVGGMVITGVDGTAETISRQWVAARFFDVLGVEPVVGRTFLQSDHDNRANAVVLSEGLWRTRFGGDPSLVGKTLRFDGEPFIVVGVVPKGFQWPGNASMWALRWFPPNPALRRTAGFAVIGRMKPNVTLNAARSDLASVAAGLAREFPDTNRDRGITIAPLHDALIGSDLRRTSLLFIGVVGFVLLICCANVANLLLARATVRTRELAVRSALGAGRRRIVRQLLTESLVLSAIGGALAVGVGYGILRAAPRFIPTGVLPTNIEVTFDARVVACCAVMALLVGILFGLAPAWQATGLSSAQALASDTRTGTRRGGRTRSVLVAGEVATAVVLLFGAGLLLRTLVAVDTVDRGYRAKEVLTMLVDPIGARYPTPASLLQFYEAIEREIRALPGVRNVAWSSSVPLGDSYAGRFAFEIVGDAPVDAARRPTAAHEIVSTTYFDTLDLPLVAGRGFDDRDTRQSVPVCIVSEALVRKYLGGRSPIGMRLRLRPASAPDAKPVVKEIVGVARQLKERPDETEEYVQIYAPITQLIMDDIFLLVRPTMGTAETLAPSVRAAIGRVDREQLVSVRDIVTLEDIASQATARYRFRAVLVVTFASLALLLAMVGVFGILAYSVQQGVREIGIRRALGATTGEVLRLVAASGGRVVGVGAVVGFVLSIVAGRLLATMLFGVPPLDPPTFAAVGVVLSLTAIVSVAAPAWRAARVDPALALRTE
jgi:putative ABC transport system permease protein